jgi:uncharacterized UBP type Zn finger protein
MSRPVRRPFRLPFWLMKLLFTGTLKEKPCSHLAQVRVVEATTDVCQECVASGDTWPDLRMCLICGYVGCCDQSKNKHARKHYEETGHVLMRAARDEWAWCYEDEAMLSMETVRRGAAQK